MVRAEYQMSSQHLEEALRLRRDINDRRGIAVTLSNLGRVAILLGDFASAQPVTEEALAISRQLGSPKGIAANLLTLAGMALLKQDYEAAGAYSEETLNISRQIGNKVGIINSLVYLAYSQLGRRDLNSARRSLLEGIETVQSIGSPFLNPELVMGAALLRLQSGDPVASAVLIGVVKAHPSTHLITRNYIMPPTMAILEKILGCDSLTKLVEKGRAIDFSTRFDQLRAELTEEERGRRGDG
jgi:tetratricopeptide (TPR) repeat protein